MSPDVLLECPRTSFRDVLRVNVRERVWHSPPFHGKCRFKFPFCFASLIGILEEIDSFYWPKMHLWKSSKKNSGRALPPSFEQNPKESIFSQKNVPYICMCLYCVWKASDQLLVGRSVCWWMHWEIDPKMPIASFISYWHSQHIVASLRSATFYSTLHHHCRYHHISSPGPDGGGARRFMVFNPPWCNSDSGNFTRCNSVRAA